MSYKVLSFRGYERFAFFEDAEAKAHEMILDVMTDGFGAANWWARIDDESRHRFLIVSCPKVGYWAKTRWFRVKEGMK